MNVLLINELVDYLSDFDGTWSRIPSMWYIGRFVKFRGSGGLRREGDPGVEFSHDKPPFLWVD